ncbi:hypothetical protein K9M48_01175 [Candidatus Gracilibacteria bacterium]|nr:hypothetical protein [Candidatus Gracilibacteria bacterium]
MKKLLAILFIIYASTGSAQILISSDDISISIELDAIDAAFEAQGSPGLIIYLDTFKFQGSKKVELIFENDKVKEFFIEACCDQKIKYLIIYGSKCQFAVKDNEVWVCNGHENKLKEIRFL